jgi:hypothetical protein
MKAKSYSLTTRGFVVFAGYWSILATPYFGEKKMFVLWKPSQLTVEFWYNTAVIPYTSLNTKVQEKYSISSYDLSEAYIMFMVDKTCR